MEIVNGNVELFENRNSEEGAGNEKSSFYQTTTEYEFRADLLFSNSINLPGRHDLVVPFFEHTLILGGVCLFCLSK